jgi:hypothetical protein
MAIITATAGISAAIAAATAAESRAGRAAAAAKSRAAAADLGAAATTSADGSSATASGKAAATTAGEVPAAATTTAGAHAADFGFFLGKTFTWQNHRRDKRDGCSGTQNLQTDHRRLQYARCSPTLSERGRSRARARIVRNPKLSDGNCMRNEQIAPIPRQLDAVRAR